MSKIRIYSLARELKLDNNQVLELARHLGAEAATASSAIDSAIADKIRAQKSTAKPVDQAQPRSAEPARRGGRQRSRQPRQSSSKREQPAALEAPTAVSEESEEPRAAESAAEPVAPEAPPAQPSHSRRQPQQSRSASSTSQSGPEPSPNQATSRSAKRYYLVDGLNVCNWQKTPSLAPLVTLLIELRRQGHSFLCIFDANTRFVLEDLGERDKYEHLLNKFDCFGEVPGGTQADDFLLFRAHKTGDAIISNDQYRDQKYRERYKWLRSVSPRLCKGIVLGGFMILPELDVHARVRESLSSIIKEFEEVYSSPQNRERQDQRHDTRPAPRTEPRGETRSEPRAESKSHESRPRADQRSHERSQPRAAAPADVAPPPESASSKPTENGEVAASAGATTEAGAEQRPRARRSRRRRGRRGGGGSGNSTGTNGGASSAGPNGVAREGGSGTGSPE